MLTRGLGVAMTRAQPQDMGSEDYKDEWSAGMINFRGWLFELTFGGSRGRSRYGKESGERDGEESGEGFGERDGEESGEGDEERDGEEAGEGFSEGVEKGEGEGDGKGEGKAVLLQIGGFCVPISMGFILEHLDLALSPWKDCNKQGYALHPRMRNLRSQRKRSFLRFILLHPHPPLAPLSSVLEGEGRIIHDAELQFGPQPPFLKKGLVQAGFGLVCEMVKKGVVIDSFTCNILVKGFCDMDCAQSKMGDGNVAPQW
nr:pentatricopeptide repeat-containing protein At5g14770, mitochondrial [Ipomoea batatas]